MIEFILGAAVIAGISYFYTMSQSKKCESLIAEEVAKAAAAQAERDAVTNNQVTVRVCSDGLNQADEAGVYIIDSLDSLKSLVAMAKCATRWNRMRTENDEPCITITRRPVIVIISGNESDLYIGNDDDWDIPEEVRGIFSGLR